LDYTVVGNSLKKSFENVIIGIQLKASSIPNVPVNVITQLQLEIKAELEKFKLTNTTSESSVIFLKKERR
jgi:hypothetical protein